MGRRLGERVVAGLQSDMYLRSGGDSLGAHRIRELVRGADKLSQGDKFVNRSGSRVPALTPLQLRLARTALKLGIRELAEAATVSPATVTRFESGRGGIQSTTLDRLEAVLQERGVILVPADATGGATIRLKD